GGPTLPDNGDGAPLASLQCLISKTGSTSRRRHFRCSSLLCARASWRWVSRLAPPRAAPLTTAVPCLRPDRRGGRRRRQELDERRGGGGVCGTVAHRSGEDGIDLKFRRERTGELTPRHAEDLADLREPELGLAARDRLGRRNAGEKPGLRLHLV